MLFLKWPFCIVWMIIWAQKWISSISIYIDFRCKHKKNRSKTKKNGRNCPVSGAWWGGSHQGKVGSTPLYPGVNPTPHWLPVPHWGELKFPRVINPDSPLNDSRQLDWCGVDFRSKIPGIYLWVRVSPRALELRICFTGAWDDEEGVRWSGFFF